jgi:hypothetical protein
VHTQRPCIQTHDTSFHFGITVGWRQPPSPTTLEAKGSRPWGSASLGQEEARPLSLPSLGPGLRQQAPSTPHQAQGGRGPGPSPTPFLFTCHPPLSIVGFFVFLDWGGWWTQPPSRALALTSVWILLSHPLKRKKKKFQQKTKGQGPWEVLNHPPPTPSGSSQN